MAASNTKTCRHLSILTFSLASKGWASKCIVLNRRPCPSCKFMVIPLRVNESSIKHYQLYLQITLFNIPINSLIRLTNERHQAQYHIILILYHKVILRKPNTIVIVQIHYNKVMLKESSSQIQTQGAKYPVILFKHFITGSSIGNKPPWYHLIQNVPSLGHNSCVTTSWQIYRNSIVFSLKLLFMTLIKNICQ